MTSSGGRSWVKRAPAFSLDGKFLLVCTKRIVTVLVVGTGERAAELSGHTDNVTGIVISKNHPEGNRAWTCSVDGTIRLWNFFLGVQIQRLDVGRSIMSMVITGTSTNELVAYLTVQRDVGTFEIIRYNLSKGFTYEGCLLSSRFPKTLVLNHSERFLGVIDDCSAVVWAVPEIHSNDFAGTEIARLVSNNPLVCMTFDPSGTMVAAGTSLGEILIWKNVGENSRDAESLTRYHWHAQPISFLSITLDGSTLISGGLEMVIVIWQLSTGSRHYIPRLGAPLLHIAASPDPAIFAVSSADNSIKFLNIGGKKLEQVLHGIKPFVRCGGSSKVDTNKNVALEPQYGRLALPTMNGTVQLYDVYHDRHAAEIVVAPMTYDPNVTGNRPPPVLADLFAQRIVVTHVVFSSDASVMVTVDFRAGEEDIGAASFLKFWRRSSGKSPYTLQTRVEEPHKGLILDLAYHPSEDIAVTCSDSCDFKIWIAAEGRWKCTSTGSYMRKAMRSACFSPDGSLLAVSVDEYITLWNPKSNGLVCVLAQCPSTKEVVKTMAFDRSNRYLIAAYAHERPTLIVWSLETLSMCWGYRVEVMALAVDPESPCFAILAAGSQKDDAYICLFNPETPVPVSAWILPLGKGGCLQFLPRRHVSENENVEGSARSSILVAFNKDREYTAFDPYEGRVVSRAEEPTTVTKSLGAPSSFEAIYGSSKVREQKGEQVDGFTERKPWGDLLNGPSHVLPSLNKVALQVFDSLLVKQKQ